MILKNKLTFIKLKNSDLQKTVFKGEKKCKPQTRIKYEPIKFDKVLFSQKYIKNF